MNNPNKDQTILVLITDPQITYLLERVLQSAGFTVVIQNNVEAAFHYAEDNRPALIVLSETLEQGKGLEVAGKFIHQFPAIPIVLLVQKDTPELLKKALRLGVSDYLCLPLRTEDILT
ncbi:MAG: response regulator, partial [Bellilinea sp.]|nr:response regulator [Bellilinea sp.]